MPTLFDKLFEFGKGEGKFQIMHCIDQNYIVSVPKYLKVTFTGRVYRKWSSMEGTYGLSSTLFNGKPYWLKKDGNEAIWYDKNNSNYWRLGHKASMGGRSARLISSQTEEGLPHKITWRFNGNNGWSVSDEIQIDANDGSKSFNSDFIHRGFFDPRFISLH